MVIKLQIDDLELGIGFLGLGIENLNSQSPILKTQISNSKSLYVKWILRHTGRKASSLWDAFVNT